MVVPIEVEICEVAPLELREVITIVTEREEISLPVTAHVVLASDPSLGTALAPKGVRMLSSVGRDPVLARTVAPSVHDTGAGTKRFVAPPRNPEYTRPDFFAEPLSDGEGEAAE
jgi:hypothetical protein